VTSEPVAAGGSPGAFVEASERYLLLADISGYTSFLSAVEDSHGVDFSRGIPAGYAIIGALLDAVVEGIQPPFDIAKLEGDAVFATATADRLDGDGDHLVALLRDVNGSFEVVKARQAEQASDHVCTGCPRAAALTVKMILHRGQVVAVPGRGVSDIHGPAVTLAHRLLKNSVRSHVGDRPYLLLTGAAASALGLDDAGVAHEERYDDVGVIEGRVVDLA
jgi:class 3 adenylate cyclase